MELLWAIAAQTALVLYDGSLYILLGFLIAGLLHEFLPERIIARHLGEESPRSVVLAALLGAPIPLCSCGVLPAVGMLRRKGASRSAMLSFAISTPETGVDSIAFTYGLLGPVMAVVRPVAAVVTAIVAGILSLLAGRDTSPVDDLVVPQSAHVHDHGAGFDLETPGTAAGASRARSLRRRVEHAVAFGFGTLLDDIAFWLVVGVLLTGVLAAMIPNDFFSAVLGWERGLLPMVVMALVGVPLYVCASASTPVAAALVAKGLSPGAALVFLLAGPATNASSLAVIGQLLGRRALVIFVGSIVGVSLAAGALLDAFAADAISAAVRERFDQPADGWLGLLQGAAAIVFVVLVARSFLRTRFRDARADLRQQIYRLGSMVRDFEPKMLLRPRVVAPLLLLAALWIASRSYLVVDPGQRGIVQRFGRVVVSDLSPGLHLHLPPPLGNGRVVDVDLVRKVPVGFGGLANRSWPRLGDDGYLLTADENLIDVRSVVHYRVSDPARFALGLDDADALVEALARRELVAIASGTPIDALYGTKRSESEAHVREALHRRMAELRFGFEVIDVRLLDVHAPVDVHEAFRDVASAAEDRQRAVNDARGYAAERAALATAEAARITALARAEGVRKRALAAAETASFAGLAAAHAASGPLTEVRLHLESLERALPAARKYVNATGETRGDVDLWLGSQTGASQAPGRSSVATAGEPVLAPPAVRATGKEAP